MTILTIAVTGLFGLAALSLAAFAALKGWTAWLDLKKLELASGRPQHDEAEPGPPSGRIELADLRERVRKLEAIASGIDL